MSTIELTAADGHPIDTWRAMPAGRPKGAIVVVQEIFGVNSHIRAVADGYAADGFLALAPAFFDRLERNYETGYEAADVAAGRERVGRLDWNNTLADLAATVAAARDLTEGGKVGVVGFCWGGTVAWRAAAKTAGIACSVAYYGGMIPNFLDEQPQVPVLMHFGEQDTTPSPETGRQIEQRYPGITEVFFYPAGHGFNCDQRASFNAAASRKARDRTLAFFNTHLAS